GCPDHPAAPDAADCGCAVLDRPEPIDRYSPSTAQDRFVHTRHRTCRFPTCGQRVGWADADHVIPHAGGGATDCANLCCLCRSHHRLKTFARSWRFTMSPDGVLTVTTPSGITRTTRPIHRTAARARRRSRCPAPSRGPARRPHRRAGRRPRHARAGPDPGPRP
ncbi:HNH endonuclease, partial [Geodermatophilus normandii]|nr:HNH endonuclease [Geodermatophilus normandii]